MGMHNAVLLLFKKAPPKIASAKIGVKFGGCGKILVKETRKIINAIKKTLIFIVLHHTEKKAKIKLVFLCWDLLFRRKYGTS